MSNNPNFFQHHPPHSMPYIPAGNPVTQPSAVLPKQGPLTKQELKKTLQRLITVSQDMDSTGKSLSVIKNPVQQTQMQEKMAALTKEQAIIIKQISDTAENSALKKEFVRLSQRIGEFQQQIKNCRNISELEELQAKMENIIDAWINVFKDLSMDAIKCSKEP